MLFGIRVTPIMLVVGGVFVFVLLFLQVLVGMRTIRFRGPLHRQVHKYGAWVLLGLAAAHGLTGLIYASYLRIG